ncbi:hypothetical protein B0H14DRAFT_974879 [Mycena olivaceomarginata]|nr:hypothetical protein B0H14DRAFT_974879 [Mycena olivaceomarginata]
MSSPEWKLEQSSNRGDGNRSRPAQRAARIAQDADGRTSGSYIPLRRIPQDILLAIFPSEHNTLIDPAEAPLLLGRICRHWRDVVYTTPTLWSSIHIPCLDYIRAPSNMILGLERTVEVWLERSSACPLSFSVFDTSNYSIMDLKKHPLMLQLLPISRRLGHLMLIGTPSSSVHFCGLVQRSLPVLNSTCTSHWGPIIRRRRGSPGF